MPTDPVPLRRIDHVRFFVGNARQSAYFYRNAFGFDVIAYAGLETRLKHEAGYVLRQGNVTFVVTAGIGPESPIVQHVARHGDGVRDIALLVENVDRAYAATTERGAISIEEPVTVTGQKGSIRRAAIGTYGDTIHSLMDRSDYAGTFLPKYHRIRRQKGESVGIETVDHIVPRSRGGGLTWENAVAACLRCNHRKANRTPEEAGMELLVMPGPPPRWVYEPSVVTA